MVLLLVVPAIVAGVSFFAARKAYDAFFVNDEAMDVNTHAKLTLEVAETEVTDAHGAAKESLAELANTRLKIWAHPMARFHELYSRLENVDLEGTKAALSQDQLAVIRSRTTQDSGASGEFATNGHDMLRPNFSSLPNNLALNSLLDLGGIFMPSTTEARLAEAEENLSWAEQTDDELGITAKKFWAIQSAAESFRDLLNALNPRMSRVVDELEEAINVGGVDFRQFTPENKRAVYLSRQFVQVMLLMLETPMVTENGNLYPGHEQGLNAGREILALEEA